MNTIVVFNCRSLGRLHAAWLLFAPLLIAGGAHAESVFKCTDGRGGVAFQATPCAASLRQTALEVHAQPLIDPDAAAVAPAMAHAGNASLRRDRTSVARASSRRSARTKEPSSYECRASDGEVFYRHTRCPHSVPGDGISRSGEDNGSTRTRGSRGRGRTRGAWGAVTVTSRKIPRTEACHRLDAVAAADRDGHARDEQVSVYEHLVGRDPCRGF